LSDRELAQAFEVVSWLKSATGTINGFLDGLHSKRGLFVATLCLSLILPPQQFVLTVGGMALTKHCPWTVLHDQFNLLLVLCVINELIVSPIGAITGWYSVDWYSVNLNVNRMILVVCLVALKFQVKS
jgi:hypothetical protein